MSFNGALPPWQRRDNFGLQAHERLVGRLNVLSGFGFTGDQEVMTAPSGTGVVDRKKPTTFDRFAVLRIASSGAFTLGAGWYWASLQQRKANTPFDPTANLNLVTYYENVPNSSLVIVINTIDHGAALPTLLAANVPYYHAFNLRDPYTHVATGNTYDVYMTLAVMFGC